LHGRDDGGVLLLDAVDVGGDEEAVPVDEFGRVGLVDDGDGDGLALLHAQDRAGGGAVVADGGEDAVGGEFDGDGRDAEGDVGAGDGGGRGLIWRLARGCAGEHDHLAGGGARGCGGEGEGAEFEEIASVHE
jgi:hypothetical protein